MSLLVRGAVTIVAERDMAFPPRDQRHQYLRYKGLQYIDTDIVDFEIRLAKIYKREMHRVQVFDFGVLLDLMAEGLRGRMMIEHKDAQGQKEMQTIGFDLYWAESARQIPDKGDLSTYWIGILSMGNFLCTPPSYTLIKDPMLRLYHRLIVCSIAGRSQAPKKVVVTDLFYLRGMDVGSVNVPYLLARYLRLFTSGRNQGAMISDGQFVARLAEHFGTIEAADDAAGAPKAAEDAPVANEGAPAIPAPVQAPQQPPLAARPARTMAQMLASVEEDVHEMRGALGE
ncbi:hypothetical protein Tco_0771140 [Tanacetum coccineum]|uniref:Polyprotein n=1 Tax=Tanacetum coccineum TaxID=301880 RepID=A0ABQ4ZE69_9ASTR